MEELRRLAEELSELLRLRKAFAHLPLPRITAPDQMPVGTVLRGRVKVDTPRGPQWRSGRRGLVRSAEPSQEGGRTGYPSAQ